MGDIIRGPKDNHVSINMGFGEYFFNKAEQIRDNIFQIDANTEQIETYGEVKTRSTRVALVLKELGLKSNDVVFICCNSGINNIIPVFATLFLGGRISSGDPRQISSDIRYLIDQVEPKVIFVEEKSIEMIEKALQGLDMQPHVIVIGNSNKYLTMKSLEVPHREEAHFSPVKQTHSDIAFIIFSSGTTSIQKGIYISSKYVFNGGMLPIKVGNLKPGVIMHFTSFYWVTSIIFTASCMLTDSAKIVGTDISGERYLYLVDKYKITFSFCANTFTYKLTNLDEGAVNKYDTSSLSAFAIGGAVMQPSQLLKLRQLLPHSKITMMYGSSESNIISCFKSDDEKAYRTKILSSGILLPNVELKVVDITSGNLLGPNQEGELRVKTPYWMSGYHKLNDPEVFDEDGFLKICDIGYYDQDNYIYVSGRLNEMFKYQLFHILPKTIENVLLSHPSVQESVAFGVPHVVDGNHPAAVVVLKPNTNIGSDELIEFSNTKLSDSHRLRAGLTILDKIPETPSGKIQRRLVRDMYIKINCKSVNNV